MARVTGRHGGESGQHRRTKANAGAGHAGRTGHADPATARHGGSRCAAAVAAVIAALVVAALALALAVPSSRQALLSAVGVAPAAPAEPADAGADAASVPEVRDASSDAGAASPDDAPQPDGPEEPANDETPLETGPDAPVTTQTTPAGVVATAPDGFLATPSCERLDQAVEEVRTKGYDLGFVLVDLDTGRSLSYNADERLYPASCIKAAYCAMVMETNGGAAGMSATVEDCLVNSSNDAFHALIDAFGLASYGSWLEAHGAPAAGADAYVYYYPWISANELASVWREVWRYGTSGEAGASELVGYLARTNHTPMGGLLRGEYEVWSKPGWYPADGSGLSATNDAGVVFSDCGPYVLVVMTDASEDFDALFPLVDALNAAHGKMCGGASAPLLDEDTRLPGA